MDGATFITNVATDFMNVGGNDHLSSSRRLRIKRAGQRSISRLCGMRDWSWLRGTGTVSITAGEYEGDLPATFGTFGKHGHVAVATPDVSPMTWAQPTEIEDAIKTRPRSDVPEVYCVVGQSTAGIKKLRVYPAPSVNTTIAVAFKKKPPTLVDGASPSGLEEIPEQWHDSVVYEMTCQLLMKGRGDPRSPSEQQAVVSAALKEMIAAEREAREAPLNVPRYGEGFTCL